MARFLTMDDVEVEGRVVIVRVDFNSPIDPKTKRILDDTRIRAHANTTLKELAGKNAKTVVLAHQGRKGEQDFISLKQHAAILSKIMGNSVKYVDDLFGQKAKEEVRSLRPAEIIVLKNVREYPEETKEKPAREQARTEFVKNLAPLADLFINDAFAAAHRAHVSIIGFTPVLTSLAGRIMEGELRSLSKILHNSEKPCVFVLGGAKADDSLEICKYILGRRIANNILTGGVIGQTFLAAKGIDLGEKNRNYLKENNLLGILPAIKELIDKYPDEIVVPEDVAVDEEGKRREIAVSTLPTQFPMYDIGAKTIQKYASIIGVAKTIVVSGPMGVYEKNEFSYGTRKTFAAIADSKAFSLAGGGHTIGALEEFGLARKISYISTAGGALMDFLMGRKLPGVIALEEAAAREK